MRGAIAAGVALALVLVACESDDRPEMPFEESPEEILEDTIDDEPGEPSEDEAMALLAGAFGPECQRLLESVDHDGAPLAGQERAAEEMPGDTDAGVTDEDGAIPEDGLTDEDGLTEEEGLTGEPGATEDAPGDAAGDETTGGTTENGTPGDTTGDDAAMQLASMSMSEALAAIPALQPLADQFDRFRATDGLDQGRLTVFAPTEDAFEGHLDGGATAGGTTDDDTTTGTAGGEGLSGQVDGAAETQDELGTQQQDEDTGIEDRPGTGEDAATDDTEDLVRVCADGAPDITVLVEQGSITTLHDETRTSGPCRDRRCDRHRRRHGHRGDRALRKHRDRGRLHPRHRSGPRRRSGCGDRGRRRGPTPEPRPTKTRSRTAPVTTSTTPARKTGMARTR